MKKIYLDPIVNELVKRKYQASYLPETNVVVVKKGSKEAYFIDGYTPIVPYNLGLILSNKQIVKYILQDAKLPVITGFNCEPNNLHELRQKMMKAELTFPLFLRQENSQLITKGIGPLTNETEVELAYTQLSKTRELIMVEPFVTGTELFVFCTQDGFCNILTKKAPRIDSVFASTQLSEAEKSAYQNATDQYLNSDLIKLCRQIIKVFSPLPYCCARLVASVNEPTRYTITELFHSAKRHYPYRAKKGQKTILVLDFMTSIIEAKCFTHVAN